MSEDLVPELDDIPVDDDAEPDDANIDHEAGDVREEK